MYRWIGILTALVVFAVLSFIFFGAYGVFFLVLAAPFFVLFFGIVSHILGVRSLIGLVLLANFPPFGFWFVNCFDKACPNYHFSVAAISQYLPATIFAIVVWLFLRLEKLREKSKVSSESNPPS